MNDTPTNMAPVEGHLEDQVPLGRTGSLGAMATWERGWM